MFAESRGNYSLRRADMLMPKSYSCTDCGSRCPQPVYLRLQLTRCGLVQARQQARHLAIPVGHFCKTCLSARVRTAVGFDQLPPHVMGFLSLAGYRPAECTQESVSLSMGSLRALGAGSAGEQPAASGAGRLPTLLSAPEQPQGHKRAPSPRSAATGRGRGERGQSQQERSES